MHLSMIPADNIQAAAQSLREAEALLVTAGAGMGVDSGLPDFRGTEGFWEAYPPFRRLGLDFAELADPQWFEPLSVEAASWALLGIAVGGLLLATVIFSRREYRDLT